MKLASLFADRSRVVFLAAFVLALCGAAPGAAQDIGRDPSAVTFLSIARQYADAMIAHGRDHYGPEDSPLFATMLDRQSLSLIGTSVRSLPEIKGVDTNERSWGAANPAHHEQLYKLLYKLTERTGEPRYAQAADSALAYFFRRTQNPSTGLVAWGEHLGWSLRNDAPLDLKPYTSKFRYTHELLSWHLWPQVFRLVPKAGKRFAQGLWRHQVHDPRGRFNRHARYDAHGVKRGGDFPRYGGDMILIWARAYANAEKAAFRREMITAIEAVAEGYDEHRSPQSGAIPVSWSSCDWDGNRCHQYWAKSALRLATETGEALKLPLPDSTKALLRGMAGRTDRVVLKLGHDPQGRGLLHKAHIETLKPGSTHPNRGTEVAYTTPWGQPGTSSTSIYALQMLHRYDQTDIQQYRTLALAAARSYLREMPDRSRTLTPKTLNFAIRLMLRAYRLTGEERFLERADTFGQTAVTMFMTEASPLPKASTEYDDYEAVTEGDDLMLTFFDLHATLQEAERRDLGRVELPPVPLNIEGNAPNPFSRRTSISYWLPQEAAVSLVVYDVLGRRVAVVRQGIERKGHHEITFEPTGRLASGVYLYRLQAGNRSTTGKMVRAR